MIYAIICFGSLAGIAGPALQSYITKHVPANEQGAVQGVFSGLQSLAGIPGPFIASHSFGWAVAYHLAHPQAFDLRGIAFFEAAVLVAISLFLAVQSFRSDASHPPAAAPGAPVAA